MRGPSYKSSSKSVVDSVEPTAPFLDSLALCWKMEEMKP